MNQLLRHLFAQSPRKSVCQDGAKIIEPKQDDTQCCFRRDRSTTEKISTLQQIFEKSEEHTKDAKTFFVDLGKVYDRVTREKLLEVLWKYSVDRCLLLAVK